MILLVKLDEAQKQMRTFELHGLGKIVFDDLATILDIDHEVDIFVGFSNKLDIIAQILEALERRGYSVPDADLLADGICWS